MTDASRSAPDEGPGDELHIAEAFWRTLLETIDVGIVACDAGGRVLVSNRVEREMFGLREPLAGSALSSLDTQIDVFDRSGRRLAPHEYPLARALAGEELPALEVVAGPVNGPYRDLSVRARQIRGENGEVLGAVAALTDVSNEKASARRLADEHRRLTEAQRVGRLGSFEYDFSTDEWAFSDNLAALWGLPAGEVTVEALGQAMLPEDRAAVRRCWEEVALYGGSATCDVRARRSTDGPERVVRCTFEIELGPDAAPRFARGTHLDITDVDRAQHQAERSNAFFRGILSASPDFMFVVDIASGRVVYVSPGKELLGLDGERLAVGGAAVLVGRCTSGDGENFLEAIRACAYLEDGGTSQVQFQARHEDGSWRWLSVRATPLRRDAQGSVVEALCVVRDVTEIVGAEERLVHAARHDYLTGLPNRAALVERLESTLSHACDTGREVAVLFCDLDGFKAVNDTGGHAVGDALLAEVAGRLVAVVRDEDVVARAGGDEFVVVIEPWNRALSLDTSRREGEGKDLAVLLAERVVEALRPPVRIGSDEFTVTASIGIACAKPSPDDPLPVGADTVLHMADLAMYKAKEQGKDQYQLLDLGTVGRRP